MNVLSARFSSPKLDVNYAYQRGKSAIAAAVKARDLVDGGLSWVARLDIKDFFDSVNRDVLMSALQHYVLDEDILWLLARFVYWPSQGTIPRREPSVGIPQGSVTSPMLSNTYLFQYDRTFSRRGHHLVRYADDILILCGSRKAATRALATSMQFLCDELGLRINDRKSGIQKSSAGFEFVGFRLSNQGLEVPNSAVNRFRARISELLDEQDDDVELLRRLNAFMCAWAAYYRVAQPVDVCRELDNWIVSLVLSQRPSIRRHDSGRITASTPLDAVDLRRLVDQLHSRA